MKQMDMSSLPNRRYVLRGMTLIELMVAIALGLIVVLALLVIFENVVRGNREMAKSSEQIESGRFAIQMVGDDLKHAGFWGDYVPVYDDLTASDVPADVPAAIPDPCLPYSSGWSAAYINSLVGIPVQIYRTPPANCSFISNQKANTDILVVRHLETCAVGETGCEVLDNNKVYFQSSLCVGTAQAGTSNTITLAAITPAVTGSPAVGSTPAVAATYSSSDVVRIVGGTGVGQTRTVSGYDQNTKVLTVTPDWTTVPDTTSSYTFGAADFLLGKGSDAFRLRAKNCVAFADRRKLISNIYYVRDDGNNASTLMRARFDSTASSPNYQIEPIVDGIEGFRAEFGVDNLGETGAAPNYTQAVAWVNATLRTQSSNRGDGTPDRYCTSAPTGSDACILDDLVNAVRTNLFVLAKTNDKTIGYVDNKTYCLATVDGAGVCPNGYDFTPSGTEQGFRRHVFSSAVRINNISGRRETP